MNKKGFTLIELIGSIIIIAAIALLTFPAVLSLLNSGQEKVDGNVIKFIKSAAEECVNENPNDYGNKCNSIENLKNNGYISTTFYDKYKNDIKEKNINNKYCFGYGDDDTKFTECIGN